MITAIGRTGNETLASLDGALKIAEPRAALPSVTINSIATGTAQAIPESAMAISLCTTGTHTGVVFAVDFSDDGTNWENGARGYANASNLGAVAFTPGSSTVKRYVFPVNGAAFYRIRSTGWSTGACVVVARALTKFIVPSEVPATQPVSGTVTATVGSATVAPLATAGLTRHRLISAATTNATLIIAGAKKLYSVHASNITTTDVYLKLYNKATAPTVGTDTPVLTLLIPGKPAGTVTTPMRFDLSTFGDAFSLGIGIALTSGVADADTAAVTANNVLVNTHYF
jgi:hypothetical protein